MQMSEATSADEHVDAMSKHIRMHGKHSLSHSSAAAAAAVWSPQLTEDNCECPNPSQYFRIKQRDEQADRQRRDISFSLRIRQAIASLMASLRQVLLTLRRHPGVHGNDQDST